MWHAKRMTYVLGSTIVAVTAMSAESGMAQGGPNPNAALNPYRVDEGWAKLPRGRAWGAAVGVDVARDGKSVWVFDRCATADDCSGSNLAPIQKFDASGRLVVSFGSGMFNHPHGLFVDRDDNVWVDKRDILYVADSQSNDTTNPGYTQGIRIGSVKDGKVTAFIPWSETGTLEGVAADDEGHVYGGFTNTLNFRRFVKK